MKYEVCNKIFNYNKMSSKNLKKSILKKANSPSLSPSSSQEFRLAQSELDDDVRALQEMEPVLKKQEKLAKIFDPNDPFDAETIINTESNKMRARSSTTSPNRSSTSPKRSSWSLRNMFDKRTSSSLNGGRRRRRTKRKYVHRR